MTLDKFVSVFSGSEKLPTSERGHLERCYAFYEAGQKAERARISNVLFNLIDNTPTK